MAKKEGWFQKAGSKWQTMPELMLKYRAAAFFGRLYAPEIMMGMHTEFEIQDIQPVKTNNVLNLLTPKVEEESETNTEAQE